MDKASMIRNSVPMRNLVSFYGYKTNRVGFMKCPFHQEKTASLKVYEGNRGFACHGCNVSGSVIDFTMKLFNINFQQAIIRISNDFNLGLTEKKPDNRQLKKLKEEQRKRELSEKLTKLIYEWHLLEYKIAEGTKRKIKQFEELTNEQAEAIITSANEEIWLLNNL